MPAALSTPGLLGAVVPAALAAAGIAVLLAPVDPGRLQRAVPTPKATGGLRGSPAASRPGPGAPAPAQRRSGTAVAACLVAAVAVALLVPAPVGLVAAAGLALAGPRLLARLEPQAVREQRAQLLRDLPLVLELLAACLAGGAALPAAVDAVGRAVGGAAGQRLLAVSTALAVGAPAAEAWAQLSGPDPAARAADPFGPAARALARAADGGAPVAAAVARIALEVRADVRGRAEQAARRVGVLSVAPLGLCFLPAFLLLGVVPLVVSLAAPLFTTL